MKAYTEITISLTEEIDEAEILDALRMNPGMTLGNYFTSRNEDFIQRLVGTTDNHFCGESWELNAETKLDDSEMCTWNCTSK